jgi:NAD(P)-dependent dehydrogenase (short-subunit alcohol dehydrogenase family)
MNPPSENLPAPAPLAVLVSGASGVLGQAIVRELAGAGHRVFAGVHQRPWEPVPGAVPVDLDVADDTSCRAAVRRVLDDTGRIDAVVHVAGVILDALLAHIGPDDWDRVFSVNLGGAMRLARAASRPMARTGGHIVHIGSYSGTVGSAGQSAYAASKAALHGFTLSLARELGSRDVRVNTVLPGFLLSPLTAGLAPERLQAYRDANLLGRHNDPAEVARFVAFLLSTRNVSGQLFALDSRVIP